MTEPDLVRLFVAPLERAGISYMVTGGVASVVYGDPRFTRDVDMVVALGAGSVGTLGSAFEGGDYYVSLEYVIVRKLEYFRASGSDRHLREVAMMLRISGDLADVPDLTEWSGRQEVEGLLEEARAFDRD